MEGSWSYYRVVTYSVKQEPMHNSCRVKGDHCVRCGKGVSYRYILGGNIAGRLVEVDKSGGEQGLCPFI